MLASEAKIFLCFPNDTQQRILHPATIKETGASGHTAELEEADLTFEAGQVMFIYYDLKRKFVKQAVRIDAVLQTEPTLVIGFQITAEPVSAESREWFRVSTIMANLTAAVGSETDCPLLDISTAGFAVEATERYEIGQAVPVTLRYRGDQFSGDALIQSVRELDRGRIRYGLHAIDEKRGGGDLPKGQQIMSAAIEREQLRRLARSG